MSPFDAAMATARGLSLDELLRAVLATGHITQVSLLYSPTSTQANTKDKSSSFGVETDADPIVALRAVLERRYALTGGPKTAPVEDPYAGMFE